MNILIFNFEYPPLGGGGAAATQHLAEELSTRHTVHIVTSRFKGLPKKEVVDGVNIHRVRVWGRQSLPTSTLLSLVTYAPMALLVGWNLGRKHSFDIINAQFVVPSGLPAVLLAKLWKLPLVVSFIGGDVFDPTKGTSPHRHPLLRWLIRMISRAATKATAISEDTKQRAQELHGVQGEIIVTHLGLTPIGPTKLTRIDLNLPANTPVFVTIGRLVPRKGYVLLLKAWQAVPEAHLVVIGGGPLKKQLGAQIERDGLADRVHLVGQVTEQQKHEYLGSADAYVSATEHEGFGIVFLEAMAHGLPIVSTNIGGHVDFLVEGRNALLVAVGDESALATHVKKLIADPSLVEAMGKHNTEDVKKFALSETVKQFEMVLHDAVYADRT